MFLWRRVVFVMVAGGVFAVVWSGSVFSISKGATDTLHILSEVLLAQLVGLQPCKAYVLGSSPARCHFTLSWTSPIEHL